ncbi:MAG: tetratricopeptide repeat protein, partial [Burkholderiaceae bacterium]
MNSTRTAGTLLSLTLVAALAAVMQGSAHAQSLSPGPAPLATPVPVPRAAAEGLTADIFYRLILGDVALQRGETSLAARAYFEAARDARDPRLAQRATEVALAARMRGLAQESAKLWSALDPAAERPKQVLTALVAGSVGKGTPDFGIDNDLKLRLEKLIADAALTQQGAGEIFLQLNRFFGEQQDRRQTYEIVRELAKPYAKNAEAHFAVALAAYNGGLPEGSPDTIPLEAVDRALALKPDWERAALLKAELLSRRKGDEATTYLQTFVAANPEAKAAAGALAQLHVEQRRYGEARAIYQKLWDNDRNAREFEFGVAVVSMQMKDWETAEALLSDLKRANYGENGIVELFYAQVADESGRYQDAVERYKAVPEGERAWPAKLRVAAMLAKQGKVVEARKYLEDL